MSKVLIRKIGSGITDGINNLNVEACQLLSEIWVKPRSVCVEIKAAAINYPDLLMTYGAYQYRPTLPFVPGTEASGVIVKVGKDVSKIQGRRSRYMLRARRDDADLRDDKRGGMQTYAN